MDPVDDVCLRMSFDEFDMVIAGLIELEIASNDDEEFEKARDVGEFRLRIIDADSR